MNLAGLYVPLITPFDVDGEVAVDALATLAGEILDAGATGLVALGATAEPTTLTPAEQAAVLAVVGQLARERSAPLLVGANTPAALAALADRPEVVAALTVVPPFIRPGEAGVVAYFRQLAAAGPVPLVVYHNPPRTGQALSVDALRQLADLPGVIGVKYAVGSIDEAAIALLADPPRGFAFLGGDDAFVAPLLGLGAAGAIMASAHLATAQYAALIASRHRTDSAANEGGPVGWGRLARLSLALFAEPNPSVIKAVLRVHGRIPTAAVRLPLLAAGRDSVEAALRLT